MPRLRRLSRFTIVLAVALVATSATTAAIPPGHALAAPVTPAGFQEQTVLSGLDLPMNIEFAPDGRLFVAEKSGVIKVFDNIADPTPTVFADLSANVHNTFDRGLLGLALHPQFPAQPWVYVSYTYDAPPGQLAPFWNDNCDPVGGANGGRCVVTARLSRLQAAGNVMTGTEQVLLHDWCMQYASHTIGDLHFGTDGALYVTGGEGANYDAVDYGQHGSPINPCADPPGGAMTPPGAEGGALRSQDVRTLGDATGLGGTLLRLNPDTGAAAAGNPLIGSSDLNARRIVAYGMRNPFRFALRPGTNDAWIGDVGWLTWEEINRVPNPVAPTPTNFGWPCLEGVGNQGGYDAANLNLCESLYGAGGATVPYYTYNHGEKVVTGESCPTGTSSVSGVAFHPASGGSYPPAYAGALFFADYSRGCIWAMLPSTPGGLPAPANRLTFVAGATAPVDLATGPGGDLYYASAAGSVRRIRYFAGNQPPVAWIQAEPSSGAAPLAVSFDARQSTDQDPADQGLLRYEWDFTDNGLVDSTSATPTFTYPAGQHTARLTVYDTTGASDTTTISIQSGNGAPVATIDTPEPTVTWRVGDTINFSGSATDPQQGTLPAAALTWRLNLHHCAAIDNCHVHPVQTFTGVASGSLQAPEHEYPSYLELVLTATDSGGLASTTSVRLNPKTVELTFTSHPPGMRVAVGATEQITPFTRTVIQGSTNTVSAVTPQIGGGTTHTYRAWSDGGAQSHVITAPNTPATYTARFASAALVSQPVTTIRFFDSQETIGENGAAANVLDGNLATHWHTKYTNGAPGHPHEIQLDLGSPRAVTNLAYTPRQTGTNGRIGQYEIYVSNDPAAWGTPVATGTFPNSAAQQVVAFTPRFGRYVRLRALSAIGGGPWTAVAELNVGAAPLPTGAMTVRSVSSQETVGENGVGANVLDARASTLWHTQYRNGQPAHPHEIQLDLGLSRPVTSLLYTPRQDTFANGRIAQYEVYVSNDPAAWGTAVATGTFTNSTTQQSAAFPVKAGRYVRLRILSEVNGGPWASAAEINVGVARIPQSTMTLRAFSSQETVGENGIAANVLDGDPATIWHTQYRGTLAVHPHQIDLDLGAARTVNCLHYLGRQDGWANGRIAGYEVYTSTDGTAWGTAAAAGTWGGSNAEMRACFSARSARYVRLRARSEVNGGAWAAAGELNVEGY
jgi:glucose/arabinose dehydrogenase